MKKQTHASPMAAPSAVRLASLGHAMPRPGPEESTATDAPWKASASPGLALFFGCDGPLPGNGFSAEASL